MSVEKPARWWSADRENARRTSSGGLGEERVVGGSKPVCDLVQMPDDFVAGPELVLVLESDRAPVLACDGRDVEIEGLDVVSAGCGSTHISIS